MSAGAPAIGFAAVSTMVGGVSWPDGASDMEPSDSVTVYSFSVVDLDALDAQATRLSKYKATRESICARPGAQVLEGTGQAVSRAELDAHGRYRRIATGWGELA
jgi:hypothetical protein